LELIRDPLTRIYIAGLRKTTYDFEDTMIKVAGSAACWFWMKEEFIEQQRWSEPVYD